MATKKPATALAFIARDAILAIAVTESRGLALHDVPYGRFIGSITEEQTAEDWMALDTTGEEHRREIGFIGKGPDVAIRALGDGGEFATLTMSGWLLLRDRGGRVRGAHHTEPLLTWMASTNCLAVDAAARRAVVGTRDGRIVLWTLGRRCRPTDLSRLKASVP